MTAAARVTSAATGPPRWRCMRCAPLRAATPRCLGRAPRQTAPSGARAASPRLIGRRTVGPQAAAAVRPMNPVPAETLTDTKTAGMVVTVTETTATAMLWTLKCPPRWR
jgi:hypothetical protein